MSARGANASETIRLPAGLWRAALHARYPEPGDEPQRSADSPAPTHAAAARSPLCVNAVKPLSLHAYNYIWSSSVGTLLVIGAEMRPGRVDKDRAKVASALM